MGQAFDAMFNMDINLYPPARDERGQFLFKGGTKRILS